MLIIFKLHLIHELTVHPKCPHAEEWLGVLQLVKHIRSQHWLHSHAQLLVGLDLFQNGTNSK